MTEVWTTLRALEWTTGRFATARIPAARLEAQILLAHALGCDRIALYTHFDKPLHETELASYRDLIKRRLAGEPVAYLVQRQEFWSLTLHVDTRVLIPRRDTETLVETALRAARAHDGAVRIAEIATGSGAIALALARELPDARVVATDLSPDALAVAADNAGRLGVAERIDLRAGDLLAPLGDERFDLLVANLPYVPSAAIDALAPEVRREPRAALDGGVDGLDLLRRLVAGAADRLEAGGLLAVEHGHDQGDAIRDLIAATGRFAPATCERDLAGNPRVTWARRLDG